MKMNANITKTFNLILFLYLCFASMANYLVDPEGDLPVPWDKVYEWSPPIAIVGAIFITLALIFWGAALIEKFWNSLISDVFKLRAITYNESLAMILMATILLM